MKKGIIILGLIAVLVFVAYLFQGNWLFYQFMFWNPKYSSSACVKAGGRWTHAPMPYGASPSPGYCYYPPKDESKACFQNSECERDCVSIGKVDSDGFILGSCGEYSIYTCTPTIPVKTKDPKTLKGGPCA